MSMNRFVGLGIFALSSSILITFASCDNSGTAVMASGGSGNNSNGNGGTNSGNSTTSSNNNQGGSSSTTKTTAASNGGSSSTKTTTAASNGGSSNGTTDTSSPSEGGTNNTDTSSTGSGSCDDTVNLIAEADSSETHNWIQKDGCGIQGAIYAYSDKGNDGNSNGADESVKTPALTADTTDQAETRDSPCADKKCCISGTTVGWPNKPSTGTSTAVEKDYNASVWGGGLGLSLGDPGGGADKTAYNGSVKGFKITLSGSVNGQAIRIGYTQSPKDESAPFSPGKMGENTVLFTDPTCPSWATEKCLKASSSPYDLQVQIVGGDAAGDFNLCIDSIVPVL